MWEDPINILLTVGIFVIKTVLFTLLGVISLLILVEMIPLTQARKRMIRKKMSIFEPIFKLIFRDRVFGKVLEVNTTISEIEDDEP